MKTTKTISKAGLVGLLLIVAVATNAQVTGSISKPPVNVGPETPQTNTNRQTAISPVQVDNNDVYETANSILFFNPTSPGSGLTLVASRTEDLSTITPTPTRAPQEFTHYRWFYMGTDGTTAETKYGIDVNGNLQTMSDDPNNNKIIVTGLEEGYHYFRVQGIVNPNDIVDFEGCDIQEEIFVVFILPQLDITVNSNSTLTNGTNQVFEFCETEGQNENQDKVSITTTYSFQNSALPTSTPSAQDFDVNYRYYAVPASTDQTSIDDATVDPVTYGTLLPNGAGVANEITDLENFFPQIGTIGTYKILVEIEYTLKERNYNDDDETSGRVRPYVIYRDLAMLADGTTPLEITVTPKPGKPHITIEGVTD